jgi:AraC-type DNA-binding domain-containing proteins
MINLNSLYHPLTAQPYIISNVHTEYTPCDALKPYIKAFWGTEEPTTEISSSENEPSLIVPDGCVDIIFTVNHNTGIVTSGYCGIYDKPTFATSIKNEKNISRFAIQLYFWSAHLLTSYCMKDSYGIYGDLDLYFRGWKEYFVNMLFLNQKMNDRVRLAEKFLIEKFSHISINNNLFNALYYILHKEGVIPIREVSAYTAISQRQLERLFMEYIGTSPKKISNLIRYQTILYNLTYSGNFDVQDTVNQYKFTDQSHMLNEFKKYHGMTPNQAKRFAASYT